MAGNSNSGRKGFVEEWKTKKAIGLATDILIRGFESDDSVVSLSDKMSKAVSLVQKAMPERIEFDDLNALSKEDKLSIVNGISRIAGILAGFNGSRQDIRQAIS